ncbi:hypothetical protein [Streptomyces sp. NPDC058964]|uniref:hypothetical protein n=1 Tax=Streptomyces sp. NPDC058964 TaxID=3346681 RepID=UPI0036C778D5
MQWTDESGGAYGDPYGGIGDTYGPGYEYGGGTATDPATAMSWDQSQLAQSAYPTGPAFAAGPGPYATGTHHHAAAPTPLTQAPNGPHGDVLTVLPPEFGTPGPSVPGPEAPERESVRPVFVDSSGRRQRRVLRAARLLVIPAGGYVALLISAVLGGPSLSAPFVPQPDSAHPSTHRTAAPDGSPGTGHAAASASPAPARKNSHPTPTQKTPGSTGQSAAATASAAAPVPTAAPTAIVSPTPIPTPDRTSKGRAIGSSHNPVK